MHPFHILGVAGDWYLVHSTWSKYNGFKLKWFKLQPIHPRFQWPSNLKLADIVNRADLGMEVMHEINAHNFPLDLDDVVNFVHNLDHIINY